MLHPNAQDRKESGSAAATARRWAAAIAKTLVSVVLLWALFSVYDVGMAFDRIGALDPWWTAAAFAAFYLTVLAAALRWWIVMHALDVSAPLSTMNSLMLVGLFFNQALPSNLGGDAIRIWRLYRDGAPLQQAVGGVLVDHVLSFVGIALVVLAAMPWAIMLIDDRFIVIALIAFIAAIVVGLALLLVLDRAVTGILRFLPDRLLDALIQLAVDSRRVILVRRVLGWSLVYAVGTHLVSVLIMVALAKGLGIPVSMGAFLVLVPIAILASLVPLSFAGWGVREGVMIALMGAIGIAPEEALALSVAFGFLLLIGSLPGAIIWLATGNRNRSEATDNG